MTAPRPRANPGPPLLRVAGLSYAVRGKSILSGITFDMDESEVRAVVGPNGAGKSTLAKCIAGLAVGQNGGIAFNGRDCADVPRKELARLVCYLPQIQGTLPAFSVRDYVMMGRYAHLGFWNGPDEGDAQAVEVALEQAQVAGLADRLLPTLSGGERQLVGIAAGLAQEARLLIMDEPATFLDPGHQELLLDLVRRLNRERGVSLLIVTHDINMAMFFTHRTLALRSGEVVFDGCSADLADKDLLRAIYGIDFAFLDIPGGGGRRLATTPAATEPNAWL